MNIYIIVSSVTSGMKKSWWEKGQQMPLDRVDIGGHTVDILIDEIQLNEIWVLHFTVITLCTGNNSSC